jgi:lactate 2-monooxygenase
MSEQAPISPIPSGMQRQQQIYTLGLTGGALSIPVSLPLLEQKAKEILPPPAFDYVAGGAGGEATMRANLESFYRWRIVPRMLRDVSKRDLSVGLFGEQLPVPVILGPVGVQGILHAEAELA